MLQEQVEMVGELGRTIIRKDVGRTQFQDNDDDYDKGV